MKTKISILAFGFMALALSISCNNTKKEVKNESVNELVHESPAVEASQEATAKEAELKSSLVCFVNNKFMGINQIPVEFEGKTYYGCCEDCVAKINNMREVRYAKDPLTGKEVDKALAYIVLSPQGNNDVLYFESEQNYRAFIK